MTYIDEENYKKNPFWDRALTETGLNYTDEEFARAWEAYLNGAEQPYSKWYTEETLVRELTEGFDILRTADSYDDYVASYTFSRDELIDIQEYVAVHGIGNTAEGEALTEFLKFLSAHETKSDLFINNTGRHYQSISNERDEAKKYPLGIYRMGY